VVVATPGRLIDHIERETIDLQDVKIVVLDEADRMLDMGFIDDVDYILRQVPSGNQMALFSATMPDEIKRLSQRYMDRPVEVLIDSDEISVETIEQRYAIVEDRNKFSALVEYIKRNGISSGIVFCGMKFRAQKVAERLQNAGFRAAPIHGDLSQNQREHTMRNFRNGYVELLVATDVAARGIDVPAVSHVINYDVPQDSLTYFHRIGRTARAGRAGRAITFVSESEYPDFNRIMGMTQVPITKITGLISEGQDRSQHMVPASARKSFKKFGQGHREDRGRGRGSNMTRGSGKFEHKVPFGNRSKRDGRFAKRTERAGGNSQNRSGQSFSFTENIASTSSFSETYSRGRRN